jgi:hypothetical protein
MTIEERARSSARDVRYLWEGRVAYFELARIEEDAYAFFLKEFFEGEQPTSRP